MERLVDLRNTYVEHNLASHDEVIRAFDDVPEMLKVLSSLEIPMGIVTSKPQSTARRGLNICGLEAYFQFVIGYDDVENPKPHPEPVFKAMGLSGAAPSDCLFIGDAPHDIHAGHAADIATAGVLWGPFEETVLRDAKPTYIFSEVMEIAQWARHAIG